MTRFLYSFLLFLLVSCANVRPPSKTWNAKTYKEHSTSQLSAAEHALNRISFHEDERVLDVGCGDGKITANIARRIGKGAVVGIDLSEPMIAYAKTNFIDEKNLSFKEMDASELNFTNAFDTVVSFSAMQWVKEQQKALDGIFRALKPDGRFLMMIPAGYPKPLQNALDEMMSSKEWQKFYGNFERGQIFYTQEQYRKMFEISGFTDVVVELVPSFDRFESASAFSNFVRQWLPHLTPIPQDQRDRFMSQLIARYLVHLPADSDNSVWFKKYSLEALVKKGNRSVR